MIEEVIRILIECKKGEVIKGDIFVLKLVELCVSNAFTDRFRIDIGDIFLV